MIKIIAVGKKHESWVQSGIERYQKRLRAPWNVEWVLLPHSQYEGDRARQEETERIMSRLDPSDYVIVLDEKGQIFDSPQLSELLQRQQTAARRVVLVVGGAYGVTDELHARADLVWSLSKLVFPHQLVRLILSEQLYRAQSIASGHGYHHE